VKQTLICVGRPGRLLEAAITEYETRARRYWSLDVVEVREERAGRGTSEAEVRAGEADRILKRVPKGAELIALSRSGEAWDSVELARRLEQAAVQGGPDVAWVIGGAFGLDESVLRAVKRAVTLSTHTLPHDLARLVLLEQIYRAGTILRGEPYHKGADGT
jgi:23S rRNA (pseudouridine1915-N3)-methyltransferase